MIDVNAIRANIAAHHAPSTVAAKPRKPSAKELAIRADERAKVIAELLAHAGAKTGHEWVRGSLWDRIVRSLIAAVGPKKQA